ncbi:MAG TPA: hypothetical protein P5550_03640 [Bacteroidales bacterium]|nr:hypothetical protein [Bacteroidales bacterium]HRZ76064.1 hypothetical protein [Bacteroidales bacterium]
MHPSRRYIILMITGLVMLGGLTAFFTWKALAPQQADLWNALPHETQAVLRINPGEFFGKQAVADSDILRELRQIPQVGPLIRMVLAMDSLYRLSPERFDGLENNAILLAMATDGNRWAPLLLADASRDFGPDQWRDMLSLTGSLGEPDAGGRYYFILDHQDTALVRLDEDILEMRFLGNPVSTHGPRPDDQGTSGLGDLRLKAGSRVTASLFIHPTMLQYLLAAFRPDDTLRTTGSWAVLDVNLKRNDIFLSGFSTDGHSSLLQLLSPRLGENAPFPALAHPEAIRICRLPTLLANEVLADQLGDTLQPYAQYTFETILQFFGLDEKPLWAIQGTDSASAKLLRSHNPGLTPRPVPPALRARLLQDAGFSPGDSTDLIIMGYGELWLIAEEEPFIRRIMADLRGGRSLLNSPWFSGSDQKLPDEAVCWGLRLFPDKGSAARQTNRVSLAWAVQAGEPSLIYLVLNGGAQGQARGESRPLLTAGTITHRPLALWDPARKRYDILVFDDTRTATLFNLDGSVIWDYPLDGIPLGEALVVQQGRSSQLRILFNTTSRIYLIDHNGRDVPGWPIDLPSPATNPVSAIDYDGRKDYRLFIATEDRFVRNLDIQGKEIRAWRKPKPDAPVRTAIQHLVMYERDYLVVADSRGEIWMTDRKGEIRMRLKATFTNADHTPFYIQRVQGETRLITTDNLGRIQAVQKNGKVLTQELGKYSGRHGFCYAPFSTGQASDYIYLDQGTLSAFNREGKQLRSWSVPSGADMGPQALQIGSQRYITIADTSSSTIFLYSLHSDAPVQQLMGRFLPLSVDLDQDLRPELVTAERNRVILQPFIP